MSFCKLQRTAKFHQKETDGTDMSDPQITPRLNLVTLNSISFQCLSSNQTAPSLSIIGVLALRNDELTYTEQSWDIGYIFQKRFRNFNLCADLPKCRMHASRCCLTVMLQSVLHTLYLDAHSE